jgi:hypothetical protein
MDIEEDENKITKEDYAAPEGPDLPEPGTFVDYIVNVSRDDKKAYFADYPYDRALVMEDHEILCGVPGYSEYSNFGLLCRSLSCRGNLN